MCDSFDMACHDDISALQLNIKVNSENLLPTTQKYNVGSLRLPADPSWPKIPQRRLADDVGDIIEPPYVVTLTGTPRRSRTVVKTSHSQIATAKETMNVSFHRQKIQLPITHPLKRRPGCTDPRFKRVTSVKSQVTSTDPLERELDKPAEMSRSALIIPTQSRAVSEKIEKTIPEKDTNNPQVTQQEAEKPGEIRGMESIGIQTVKTKDTENTIVQSGTEIIVEHSLYKSGDVESLGKSLPKTNCSPEGTRQKQIESDTLHSEYYSPIESPRNHSDVLMSACKDKDAEQEKCVTVIGENNSVSNLKGLSNVPMNLQSQATPLQYCQGNNGQLFFMVEKKVQSSPMNTVKIDSICKSHCQCTTQCYNVQVPVLSYQNVPVRISAQTQAKVDIPPQSSQSKIDVQQQYFQHNLQPEHDQSQEREHCFPEANKNFVDVRQKAEVLNTTDKIQYVAPQKCVLDANRPDALSHINCQQTDNAQLHLTNIPRKDAQVQNQLLETTDSEYYATEKTQKYTCNNQQRKVTDDTICCRQEVTDSECYVQENMKDRIMLNDVELISSKKQILPKREVYFAQCERNLDSLEEKHEALQTHKEGEGNMTSCRLKRKIKSNQYLPHLEARCIKNCTRSSEPHITVGRKKGAIPYLRKAHSYFSKYAYPLRVDSNKTLTWSGCQRSRRRYSVRHSHKVRGNKKEVSQNLLKKVQSTNDPRKQNVQIKKSPGVNTDVPIEKPTAIPIKTQQLLNRSYWEYYNKLRLHKIDNNESAQQQYFCQVAMGAPRIKRRRAEELNDQNRRDHLELSLPEIRTLEQCSVLSSMINKTLDSTLQPSSDTMQTKQLYINGNMKSSSDPTAGTQSAVIKKIALKGQRDLYQESILSSTFLNKHKYKREKHVDKRLLKLRTIVFFGCMMYAMIVLLPMIYDYFFYEEYDDYDDLSYIELTLDYIVSSFREAFGGFFNAINKIFFRLRACRKCNNIA